VETLDLADVFATFFILLGPQKVLVPVRGTWREVAPAMSRRVAVLAGVSAAVIGVVFAEITRG
jgi:hypothetical protein